MEKGEKSDGKYDGPESSKNCLNYFDSSNALGHIPFPPYGHLASLPAEYSMLGGLSPFPFASPFAGLAGLDPLRTAALAQSAAAAGGLSTFFGTLNHVSEPTNTLRGYDLLQQSPFTDGTNAYLHAAFGGGFSLPVLPPSSSPSNSLASRLHAPTSLSSSSMTDNDKGPRHKRKHSSSIDSTLKSLNKLSTTPVLSIPTALTPRLDAKEEDGEEQQDHNSGSDDAIKTSFNKSGQHQMDGLRRQKVAEQIRQKMLNKVSSSQSLTSDNNQTGSSQSLELKSTSETETSSIAEDSKSSVDSLKRQLEEELRQQRLQLKLLKKAQAMKEEAERLKHKDSSEKDRGPLAKLETVVSSSFMNNGLASNSHSHSESDTVDDSKSTCGVDSKHMNHELSDTDTKGTCSKRYLEDMTSATMKKQRIVDELELRIPLEMGWRRETRLRETEVKGLVGEVLYYTPCGRKLRLYQEVEKYILRNNITDLSRENFSFSARYNVGDFFYYQTHTHNFVRLSEEEVQERLQLVQKKRGRPPKYIRHEKDSSSLKSKKKHHHHHRHHHNDPKRAHKKFLKKLEKQNLLIAMQKAKQIKALSERKKRILLLKEHEKLQKQEQQRIERERKAQQIIEERKRRRYLLERARVEEALQRAQEREMKRQQAMMLKEQERERRRQHLLLVKALEARRRQNEKVKLKEEKRVEKIMERERKLETRRLELQMAEEMRIPRDDLELDDHKDLPDYGTVGDATLSGSAVADLLMIVEFLFTFGEALNIDSSHFMTLEQLQHAVLNKSVEDLDRLTTLLLYLIQSAIGDPGVPNPKEAMTSLNQKLTDIVVNEAILSEILRIFIRARNGHETEVTERLKTQAFETLNPNQKVEIVAFLCNELLSSKKIMSDIDNNIENIATLRKDRWLIEGKVRKLRTIQNKKFNNCEVKASVMDEGSLSQKRESDDEDAVSGAEMDGQIEAASNQSDDDEPLTNEECDKRIDKLQKQHSSSRKKVFEAYHKLRVINFGQDRYRRTYWLLPHCGGIFIEGIESGEVDFSTLYSKSCDTNGSLTTDQCTKDDKNEGKQEMNDESKQEVNDEGKQEVHDGSLSNPLQAVDDKSKIEETTLNSNHDDKIQCGTNTVKEEATCSSSCNTETCNLIVKSSCSNIPSTSCNSHYINCIYSSVNDVPRVNNCIDVKTPLLPLTTTHLHRSIDNKCDIVNTVHSSTVNCSTSCHSICSDKLPCLPQTSVVPYKTTKEEVSATSDSDPSSTAVDSTKDQWLLSSNNLVNGCQNHNHSDSLNHDRSDSRENQIKSEPSSHLLYTSKLSELMSLASFHDNQTSNRHPLPNLQPKIDDAPKLSTLFGIDSLLKKEPVPLADNHFLPQNLIPIGSYSTELMLKNQTHHQSTYPWFDLVPRIPCDQSESSAATLPSHVTTSEPVKSASESKYSVTAATYTMCDTGHSFHPVYTPASSFTQFNLAHFDSSQSLIVPMYITTPTYIDHLKTFSVPAMQYSQVLPSYLSQDSLPQCKREIPSIPKEFQKGWWKVLSTDELEETIKCLHPRGIKEKQLMKSLQRYFEYISDSFIKTNSESKSVKSKNKNDDNNDDNDDEEKTECDEDTFAKKTFDMEMMTLEEVENLEDRVFSASLQMKDCSVPPRITELDNIELVSRSSTELAEGQMYPVELARERLANLEKCIERRYLKPPLSKCIKIRLSNITSEGYDEDVDEASEENAPAGLITWRRVLTEATSPAQVALCAYQLAVSIAWEKSIMRVVCQLCCKDDNEDQLLLCDSCDRGYHTYCFKPEMENIPEGNWYCYQCVSKVTGMSHCIVCGQKSGDIAECNTCPRAIHIHCMDPPLMRVPQKWACELCRADSTKKKRRCLRRQDFNLRSSTDGCVSPEKLCRDADRERRGSFRDRKPSKDKSEEDVAESDPAVATEPIEVKAEKVDAVDEPVENNHCIDQLTEVEGLTVEVNPAPPPLLNEVKTPKKLPEEKKKKNHDKKPKEKTKRKTCEETKEIPNDVEVAEKKKEKSSISDRDAEICRRLLTDMEAHSCGGPFKSRVNFKKFPQYRKVIKKPMCFSAMSSKLKNNTYKCKEDFAEDARLIFANCEIFNEDDSEIGMAGHTMKSYFERRWSELTMEFSRCAQKPCSPP